MAPALHCRIVDCASIGAARSIILMIAVACPGNNDRLARKAVIVERSAAVVVAPNFSTLNPSSILLKTLSVGSVGTSNVAGTPGAAPVASGETHTFAGRGA
jgi:hypothetical protein